MTRIAFVALAFALAPPTLTAQVGPPRSLDAKVAVTAPGVSAVPAPLTTVSAGEKYRAGAMRRWFLGDTYRDLWTTAMRVPTLDLDTYAGGLTPIKAGGGMQTKSLRLVTEGGSEYVFRCVQKDHAWTVPASLKGGVIERMSQDQVSTEHPAGALVAAPLLEAAGVLHSTPVLVFMPPSAALGKFSADFAGKLGILEPYPQKPDSGEGYSFPSGAAHVIDSEQLLKRMNASGADRVDARAYLTARIMDMFLGDWDRHQGQWKWLRMQSDAKAPWLPLPRDRDNAFVTYDGVVAKVGHLFSPVSAAFSGVSANASALTWNSLEMDRRLLLELTKAEWTASVAEVSSRLTDSVIDDAVLAMPVEYRSSAPLLARMLKERRSRLPALTAAFYALVVDVADIHATDEAERAMITRVSDGVVEVRVESAEHTPLFARRFTAAETREIRVYLHGGDDSAVVRGDVRTSIPVRVVGGNGNNWLADSALVNGRANATHWYDSGSVHGVTYGKDTLFNRQHWERGDTTMSEPAGRDRGSDLMPNGGIGADRGMGLTPRLGITRITYGFERRPYATSTELEASFATGVHGWRLLARGDQRLERSPVHFTELVRYSRLELINYYGLGNATGDSGRVSSWFGARQHQILLHPAVAISLGTRSDLSLGPIVQYSHTDSTPNQFLSTTRPYGFGSFGQAGLQLNLHHDLQDRSEDPEQRFVIDLNGNWFPALWDVKRPFEVLSLAVATSLTLAVPTRPMLVVRAGAKKVLGDFPFHESAFVGGNHTTRYMEGQRYAGDASLYASSELRVPVAGFSLLIPFDVGVLALAEGGRVWMDGASPGGWHSVFGGGLWVSLRGNHMRAITLTMANESGRSGLHLRTGLGF